MGDFLTLGIEDGDGVKKGGREGGRKEGRKEGRRGVGGTTLITRTPILEYGEKTIQKVAKSILKAKKRGLEWPGRSRDQPWHEICPESCLCHIGPICARRRTKNSEKMAEIGAKMGPIFFQDASWEPPGPN